MTIRTAIQAMLQRFTGQQTNIPDAMPGPCIGDDPWLMNAHARLQRELNHLYETTEPEDMNASHRIARILRAFHLMETGEYGLCACCGVNIAKGQLEADPTRDICEACG